MINEVHSTKSQIFSLFWIRGEVNENINDIDMRGVWWNFKPMKIKCI